MNNVIDIGYTSRLSSILTQNSAPSPISEGKFADAVAQAHAAQTTETQEIQAPSAMSLEEYKASIKEKISSLPMSASTQMQNISVHISDEGFEAMRNDPEYEEWVLDTLAQNFRFQNPWTSMCGGGYVVHTFGATKEQYHGESWYPGYQNGQGGTLFDSKSEGSYWEKRSERHRQNMALQEELAAKRKMQAKLQSGDPISIAELLLGLL